MNPGSDSNTGCDRARPLLTIGHAVHVVPAGGEVHVCTGTYVEQDLTLLNPILFLGSYDCVGWVRASDFGPPNFDGVTIIQPSTTNLGTTTLTVGPTSLAADASAGAVDSGWVIEGFDIVGGMTTPPTTALLIRNGASPVVTSDHIEGGFVAAPSSVTTGFFTALSINAASPNVEGNRIDFPATTSALPSVAVFVQNNVWSTRQVAQLSGNTISAGSGTGSPNSPGLAGSVGVAVTGSKSSAMPQPGGATLVQNVITAGAGTTYVPSPTSSSIGVVAYGGVSLQLLGNAISGGTGVGSTDAGVVETIGVSLSAGAAAQVVGNRIYGGAASAGNGGSEGIGVSDDSNVVIVNNIIHGGGTTTGSTIAGARTQGINVFDYDAAVIEDNTILAGSSTLENVNANEIVIDLNGHNAVIRGNVLAAKSPWDGGTPSLLAVAGDAGCNAIAQLSGNVFVGDAPQVLASKTCHIDGGSNAKVATLRTIYADGGGVQNVLVAGKGSCSPSDLDAGACLPDCPKGGCLPWFLAGWVSSNATPGNGMFSKGTWGLSPEAGCLVGNAGIDLSSATAGPSVTTDIDDASRPVDGSSPGATQFVGACK